MAIRPYILFLATVLVLNAPVTASAMSKAELNALALRGNHNPPARYDHKPTVPFKLDIVPHWQIEIVCGKAKKRGDVRPACTSTGPKGTWVFISDWLSGRAYDIVLRHEYGHVNGWPQNHGR